MATAEGKGSGEPDMSLIAELLEEISRHPPAIDARKLLLEHYMSIGWLEGARNHAKELKKLAPADLEVTAILEILSERIKPPHPVPSTTKEIGANASGTREQQSESKARIQGPPAQSSELLETGMKHPKKGDTSLRKRAASHVKDFVHQQKPRQRIEYSKPQDAPRAQGLLKERIADATFKTRPPLNSRSVARTLQNDPKNASELAIGDLEDMIKWLREPQGKHSEVDNDTIREALAKRVRALEAILPKDLKSYPEIALMHIEHERLDRKYVNAETMLGDKVEDIPRENFWVTEDNYAWDMDELAQAITANGGVMRNPLSRIMFTTKDIQGILAHPMGKRLAALQVEQNELSKGIRPDTITQLEKLSKVLLEDQSSDALASRHAVDEFAAYLATLPEAEQKALNKLRCTAKDAHTGQSYDGTVGDAVRAAKGNQVCFHKTGDFLGQAAAYLRQNKGVAQDIKGPGCVVM